MIILMDGDILGFNEEGKLKPTTEMQDELAVLAEYC